MEEKNELNDIILNKSGGGSGSKKLLLAIAALTLILIIVLVIMNSLKSESNESAPQAAMPPEPTAPTEIIDDPLFEPVEVIQEGNTTPAGSEDLGQIAQKIKQESFDNAPVQETTVVPAPVTAVQTAPVIQSKPAAQSVAPAPAAAPLAPKAAPKPAAKPVKTVINTPTIKSVKPAEAKKVTETATKPATTRSSNAVEKPEIKPAAAPTAATAAAPKATDAEGVYYIQVGSFSKQPNQALFDRLNASGMKYTTIPSGAVTKVMVGPFKGEKAARDILGTVRRNIESGAYITKG